MLTIMRGLFLSQSKADKLSILKSTVHLCYALTAHAQPCIKVGTMFVCHFLSGYLTIFVRVEPYPSSDYTGVYRLLHTGV